MAASGADLSSTANTNENGANDEKSISLVSYEMICNSPVSDASSGYESCATFYSSPDRFQAITASTHVSSPLEPEQVRASADSNIQCDFRVAKCLLSIETNYVAHNVRDTVYESSLCPVDGKARSIVVGWMLEVCEELHCEDAVFPLAVNTLDRFIEATPDIRKAQLQLLAVVCLSLASKIRDCNTLSLNDLSHMTEYSATVSEIQHWEPLVLAVLKWDISSIIPNDYLDSILYNLHDLTNIVETTPVATSSLRTSSTLSSSSSNRKRSAIALYDSDYEEMNEVSSKRTRKDTDSLLETVRRHAVTLISLCSCELDFVAVRPSIIAAACVVSAMRGIFRSPRDTIASFCHQLQFDIDSDLIESTVSKIEQLFASQLQSNVVQHSNAAIPIVRSSALSSQNPPNNLALEQRHGVTHFQHSSLPSNTVAHLTPIAMQKFVQLENRLPSNTFTKNSTVIPPPSNPTSYIPSAHENFFGKSKQFLLNTSNTTPFAPVNLNTSQTLMSFTPRLLNSSRYQDDEDRENIPVHLLTKQENTPPPSSSDDEFDDSENSFHF